MLLMVDQKAKFVPRGMSAQFVGEVQCDPQAVESIRKIKAQSLIHKPRVAFVESQLVRHASHCNLPG